MPTYSPQIASGSTNGKMVKVAATSTPGTLLHTAHATDYDEVYVWAVNSSGSGVKLTIELGGTGAPDDLIEKTIAAEDGLTLIVPGIRLTGGVVVRAFAASGNVILCAVNVNRISS